MAAPRKDIPENVGLRIRQLNTLRYGSRRIARAILQEFGQEHNYSHQHVQNYLNATAGGFNVPPIVPVVDSYYEKQPVGTSSDAAWPDMYVKATTYPTQPATIIVPSPYPQNPPSDSMIQVMLDLVREKGKAEIWRANQPPQAPEPPALPSLTPQQVALKSAINDLKASFEAFARNREARKELEREEKAKAERKIQDEIDQLKKMNEDSKKNVDILEVGKENQSTNLGKNMPTGLVAGAEPSASITDPVGKLKGPDLPPNQPRPDATGSLTRDSQTIPPVTTPGNENSNSIVTPTGGSDSIVPGKDSKKGAETETLTPATTSIPKTSTPDMSNNKFSQQPGSTDFTILKSDQNGVIGDRQRNLLPGSNGGVRQFQSNKINEFQTAGQIGGSQNRQDGSFNDALAIGGLVGVSLAVVFGIDYAKAQNQKRVQQSTQNAADTVPESKPPPDLYSAKPQNAKTFF